MGVKDLKAKAVGREMAQFIPEDGKHFWQKPALLKLNICLFCLFLFSAANGYDGSMMNGLQALPQWHTFMNHPTGSWLGFVNAVQSLGACVCYPLVAWSNNRFGRKKTIAVGYFWLVLGTTLQTAASNSTMFVLGRLFIGGVSAFFSGAAPLLITEVAFPTHRAIVTAFFNSGWYVGGLVAAWTTFGTRNYPNSWAWRIPSVCQALIPIAAFAGFILSPESPRWLISVGRHEEARAILVKYHGDGNESSPLVAFEVEEITKTLALEKEAAASTTYADMFRTKGRRHRSFITITLGIFAQWNGVGIVSYYLAPVLTTIGITSVTSQTMISGFLQIWNLIFAVGAAFSVDRLGRRKLFLASCVGMLSCYIVIAGLSGSFAHTNSASTGIAVIPFLFLFYGMYDIAFTPFIISYTCEIWPYMYRGKGISMALMSTQLAVFFNIFVNPIALQAIQWKYYIVYVVILIGITITIYFFYPETNGHSLEEMARVFDGDHANVIAEGEAGETVEKRMSVSGPATMVGRGEKYTAGADVRHVEEP